MEEAEGGIEASSWGLREGEEKEWGEENQPPTVLMAPSPWARKEGAGGWARRAAPFSALPPRVVPLPPTGEEQSGNQHPQRHGSLRGDSHSSHGLRCH